MKTLTGEIERLRSILEDNPQSMYFARLAEYLLQLNNISEAIELCIKGLQFHPEYANGHFVLGMCYYKTDDIEKAESEFNKTLLYDPEHLQAHHYLARIMQSRGWHNTYIVWLKRALTVDPFDPVAKSLLEEAEEELEQKPTPAIISEEEEQIPSVEWENEEIEEEPLTERVVEEENPPEEPVGEEPTQEEAVASEEEDLSDKDYEYILDDIFKDEVAPEEDIEEAESGTESLEDVEKLLEQEEEDIEAPEGIESEEDVISQIRQKMDEFDEEEGESWEEQPEPISGQEPIPGLDLETEEPSEEVVEEEESESLVADESESATEVVFGEAELEEVEQVEEEKLEEAEETGVPPEEDKTMLESEKPEPQEMPGEEKSDQEEEKKKEPFVTSTLGEIYAAQGHYVKAIGVYEILLKKHPDNEVYKQKIEELKRKLEEEAESNDSQEE